MEGGVAGRGRGVAEEGRRRKEGRDGGRGEGRKGRVE